MLRPGLREAPQCGVVSTRCIGSELERHSRQAASVSPGDWISFILGDSSNNNNNKLVHDILFSFFFIFDTILLNFDFFSFEIFKTDPPKRIEVFFHVLSFEITLITIILNRHTHTNKSWFPGGREISFFFLLLPPCIISLDDIEKTSHGAMGKLTVRCPPPSPPLHLSIYRALKKSSALRKSPGTGGGVLWIMH